jgi:hypothetical protein
LTGATTQRYSCVVIPAFDSSGKLPSGIHLATWKQIVARLGFTTRRKLLLNNLRKALAALKAVGVRVVYLDGSFVTSKAEPGDFDACWGIDGVKVGRLDPVFLDFSNSRARQKQRFSGEFFPAALPEGATGKTYLEFFQIDKETGSAKGILAIDIRRFRP